jgi:rhamnose utilization protein RhaD (predicted bifunctional aldolase and dehydrogenase)
MASVAERTSTLHSLKDLWDDAVAATLDEAELLRYRSNLLGADLRITNFAGGNTSTKAIETDPLTGQQCEVMWVKGSGGDLGSMKRSGLASLYLEKLHALEHLYRGVELEDEMAEMYPLCTFRNNPVAASIDTPLHGFLPFPHVDHLHPDWGIALAASANGVEKMAEFNQRYGHRLVWVPWQRPGFELGMMMKRTIAENPGCDGIVLGGHGLFTWGETHRESYLSTITIIDQLGQFIQEHVARKGDAIFGGAKFATREGHRSFALEVLPYLRGQVSGNRRVLGSYSDLPEVLKFVNSNDAEALAYLGTSCPDHFIRTKIRPLYVKWDPAGDLAGLKTAIADGLRTYRKEYAEYYQAHAQADSPAMRDDNPSIVLIAGVGMFAHHRRVLYQCDPRDGGRKRSGGG